MAKTTTEMKLVSIDKLIPYVNNARTHSPEQINKLRSSLREFGFVNPVIIDQNFNVVAGHGRLMAAREEGFTEVPCVLVDYLTEAQRKAYILADNRYAEDAGWDEEMLRVEIEALQEQAFDLSLTGLALTSWPTCSRTIPKRLRMMTSTSLPRWRRLPSWNPATSGPWASTACSAAMPPKPRMSRS